MNERMDARDPAEGWHQHYIRILELITSGASLSEALEEIAQLAETRTEGISASLHLISSDGEQLDLKAGPSLPTSFGQALDNLPLDQGSGAHGSAALTGDSVIVKDIEESPDWTDFLGVAKEAGVRACYLEPLRSPENQILGTLAFYSSRPGQPTLQESQVLHQTALLGGLAVHRIQRQQDLRRTAVVLEQCPVGVMVTDTKEKILTVNRAFSRITGYTPREVVGRTPRILHSGRHDPIFFQRMWEAINEGGWQGEIWNRRKTGAVFPTWTTITPLRNEQGEITHFIGMLTDISDQKNKEARIEELAFYDSLTRLPNRALFMDRFGQALSFAKRQGLGTTLLFMDLNDFKEINDTQGHHVGDEVLIEVANRFQRVTRESDTLARFGGDEFALLAEGGDREGADHLAQRLEEILAEPVQTPSGAFQLGVSIGIARAPNDGESPEELIKNADIAMYRVKTAGGGHHFYQADMGEHLHRRIEITDRLSRALEGKGLQLYYQPQVELRSNHWGDTEALIRWFDPDLGFIPPTEFVPLAEERGLAPSLGNWVLRAACQQLRSWQGEGQSLPGRLAINVAVPELEEADFPQRVQTILTEMEIPPQLLEMEVTESALMKNMEKATQVMKTLADLGIQWAIDDFGTGYSSLVHLKHFPASKVKIEKSFIGDMLDDPNNYAMVSALINMAHNLGITVVAEGVETADHVRFLRRLGCDSAQGNFFTHPNPPKQTIHFSASN